MEKLLNLLITNIERFNTDDFIFRLGQKESYEKIIEGFRVGKTTQYVEGPMALSDSDMIDLTLVHMAKKMASRIA